MAGNRRFVLSRLALACPICITPAGTAMANGVQAGALVLVLVAIAVLVPIVRFGWRMWTLEQGLQRNADSSMAPRASRLAAPESTAP